MNKSQLIEQVAERLEMSRKEAAEVVEAVIQAITESVAKGERVAISGFVIFEQVFRAARTGRNPRTGETVKIGAVTIPKFRPGTDFKNIVAGARDMTQRVTGGSGGAEAAEPKVAEKATAAKKTATKKATAAKKTATKKATAAKKTATKKATAAKKTATKKATAAKKTATKKATAAKKTATKKATAAKEAANPGS